MCAGTPCGIVATFIDNSFADVLPRHPSLWRMPFQSRRAAPRSTSTRRPSTRAPVAVHRRKNIAMTAVAAAGRSDCGLGSTPRRDSGLRSARAPLPRARKIAPGARYGDRVGLALREPVVSSFPRGYTTGRRSRPTRIKALGEVSELTSALGRTAPQSTRIAAQMASPLGWLTLFLKPEHRYKYSDQ